MKTAAFFDMDGTLLRGESQLSFLLWMLKRGHLPFARTVWVVAKYAGYVAGLSKDATSLRQCGFSIIKDLRITDLEREGELFLSSIFQSRVRKQALSLVHLHRGQGHLTVLVTSASEVLARPAVKHLQMQDLIATRFITRDGICTGECASPDPYGIGKRFAVESYCATHDVRIEESFAYADHSSDTPLLEYVGHPVVTNANRHMRGLATERGWRVLDLERPLGVVEEIIERPKRRGSGKGPLVRDHHFAPHDP